REPDTYTHGHHESVLRSHRWRTVENSAAYLIDRLQPGTDVLDVGCGPGTITVDMAARVAPGRVVGIDTTAEVIQAARAEAEASGASNVELRVDDVQALGFDDDTFDVVHAHQVLQHLTDPVGALREMRRVCRPGGVVAARDSIYRSMAWFPADPRLDRWLALYCDVAEGNGGEPDAGSRLLRWARSAGFADVASSGSAWCYATAEERAWWGGLWADRITSSRFGDQAVGQGLADRAELEDLADAWRGWARHDDAWFAVLHGEIRAGG
ncbi:MAG: methyltransferase domain-containing protein, partial [Acidimicrobiales bacterium]